MLFEPVSQNIECDAEKRLNLSHTVATLRLVLSSALGETCPTEISCGANTAFCICSIHTKQKDSRTFKSSRQMTDLLRTRVQLSIDIASLMAQHLCQHSDEGKEEALSKELQYHQEGGKQEFLDN
ncbi:hypothetical protein CLAIMM_03815 isoform 4 [Cladophialophora immunda]|nr:hypothetical protein CLAIMM_03815 isoform 1 [Cladophialophora immunda]OQU97965.1 hypothetical protein CLAIMM_03815 isoform 4 [Cladophialophora immunda]